MKRLFFLYMSVFLFALVVTINGLREMTMENEHRELSPVEQLTEPEENVYFTGNFTFTYVPGADEGLTVPHGRRFGLNKPPKYSLYFHHYLKDGRYQPVNLSFSGNERHFMHYLTIRHSQGFYIYSLRELLL